MKLYCRAALSIAAISLCCLPGLTVAQDSSHTLTVMDEFQIQTAVDPQISPDGKKIVYVRRFADPMTDKRYSNLWIINADGADHRPISSGNHSYTSPRWSPDGTRIAFLSDIDGKSQLYVRWMDTGQTARITNLEQSPDAIAWSPDGRMISSPLWLPVRVRILLTCPRRPPAQSGRTRRPPTIAWSIASTALATSSPAIFKSSSFPPKAAHRAR